MLAQDRYQKILELLEQNDSVRVSNLIKIFNVSMETIRRDLDHLEKKGLLKKVYGGAVRERINTNQASFNVREKEFIEEKQEIAKIAIRYITEGQSIALNSGTTTLEIAKLLKINFEKLTILTNSVAIALELSDMSKYTIILCGGIFNGEEYSLAGEFALENISKFRIDTAFISVSGISLLDGFTDHNLDEIQIQRKLIEISQQVFMLSDSSKFDTLSLLKLCDISKADMIITDSKLNDNILNKYKANDIEVINK
ncbi:transcriptional regulator, DeoR family [Clostridium cavendishii DSM 21758]|uniref:Transcriptional regulator, DeoR family n=1 Tax=Clostridium cavendishii DSM 21758 TaxID=1121302 RepID=A0A1M6BMX4_9CLOT|nr:DeoR/GlpR family DNA-binding transcription regulator [Clostridium cavendishii]SHI50007.1 transcriptional regulator, DeoR family [Clostridium cavendishii DSM 21758]